MTPRAIEHITLTTGAARMSPCSEVDDRVLARVRSDMAAGAPLMGTEWRATLLPTPEGGHVYDLTHDGAAVARCWLCVDPAVSEAMWDSAQSGVADQRVAFLRDTGEWCDSASFARIAVRRFRPLPFIVPQPPEDET